jgi:hypothetical protein
MSVFKVTSDNPTGYDYTQVNGVSASGKETIYTQKISTGGVDSQGLTGNNGNFSPLSIPGGLSVGPAGITEDGDTFGSYSTSLGSQGHMYGFVDLGGKISTISYPGSLSSEVSGVDNSNHIVGDYTKLGSGNLPITNGFLDYNGVYTDLIPPGAVYTFVHGINPYGQVFGQYVDKNDLYSGFVYSTLSGFSQIDVPGATQTSVTGDESVGGVVTGGPSFGKAVGTYIDKSRKQHGFIDFNGSISAIDVPGATDTNITGINDSGEIVGASASGPAGSDGFVYDYGVFYKVDFPGATYTRLNGVNAEGEFYGSYTANGVTSGFVGSLSLFDHSSAPHANDLSYSRTASGPNHFVDIVNFEASYSDLIAAFGTNQAAMQNWYNAREPVENRPDTFDGLDYVASYGDLLSAFGGAGSMKAVQDTGASQYISYGEKEGRSASFNGLDYVASYSDLIKALGANNDAGAYHYIQYGHNEGRTTSFDGLDYIASHTDLIQAFGANEQAGAAHFIDYGYNEGRTTTFDGLAYIANYTDLMNAFGANNDAGAAHYIGNGHNEGRSAGFNVGAYESAHPDLIGKFSSNDAFLTAYINTYKATGTVMT